MFYRPIMWTLLKIEAGGLREEHNCKELGVCSLPEFISNALAPRHRGVCSQARPRSWGIFIRMCGTLKSTLLISYPWLLIYFSWPTQSPFKLFEQCDEDGWGTQDISPRALTQRDQLTALELFPSASLPPLLHGWGWVCSTAGHSL